ncbi:unnamed protein product [Symbiodinium sp. CCMP2592]|nr:unnamed protein product [Symbiodinium sp. CCMP2592]
MPERVWQTCSSLRYRYPSKNIKPTLSTATTQPEAIHTLWKEVLLQLVAHPAEKPGSDKASSTDTQQHCLSQDEMQERCNWRSCVHGAGGTLSRFLATIKKP